MKEITIAILLSLAALSFAANAQSHGEMMVAYCSGSGAGGWAGFSCSTPCETYGYCY